MTTFCNKVRNTWPMAHHRYSIYVVSSPLDQSTRRSGRQTGELGSVEFRKLDDLPFTPERGSSAAERRAGA